MVNLPVDHPDVRTLEFYGRSFFSVQLAGGSLFRKILVDQTMDVTFNKDKDDRHRDKFQLEDRRYK